MIEYLDEPHLYIWDGVIMPSVTEVIRSTVGAGMYKDVPASVLRKKAEYGTTLHDWCEYFMLWGEKKPIEGDLAESAEQFVSLVGSRPIRLISAEQIVGYDHKVCGRFDLLADEAGVITLIDYKTTSRYHEDYLSWQMSIYALAIEQSMGFKPQSLACIWMPKGKKIQYREVPWKTKEEVDKLLEEYLANEA